jgi:phosphoglycerate kinase
LTPYFFGLGWGSTFGPGSVEAFRGEISGASTTSGTDPMGVFEIDAFAKGTEGVAAPSRGERRGATSVIGGATPWPR